MRRALRAFGVRRVWTFLRPTLIVVCLLGVSSRAIAQTPSQTVPQIHTSWAVDGSLTLGALVLLGASNLIHVDTGARWSRELVSFDEPVKRNFSADAAKTSDVLVTLTVAMPLFMQAAQGFNETTGKRSLVFGETLAIELALNGLVKHWVGRPRPYVYNDDPRVQAWAAEQTKDSHVSFFSGHASTSFAAAVAGGYLFSQTTTDTKARAAVWGTGLALASATSNLRVRAGKHFYSDVIVGAVVGAAAGFVVPYLHYRNHSPNGLATAEWVAIGAGPVVGIVASQLMRVHHDLTQSLDPPRGATSAGASTVILPWVGLQGAGAGLMLARSF